MKNSEGVIQLSKEEYDKAIAFSKTCGRDPVWQAVSKLKKLIHQYFDGRKDTSIVFKIECTEKMKKAYYGTASLPQKQLCNHFNLLNSDKGHHCEALQDLWDDFGILTFRITIIEETMSIEAARDIRREILYILPNNKVLNTRPPKEQTY